MGQDGRVSIFEFWTVFLNETEVGDFGSYGRFRPSYYFFRVGQAVLLGDNPHAWYLSVFAAYALTCGILGYTVALWLATSISAKSIRNQNALLIGGSIIGGFIFAGLNSWSGIVGRLGPSELLGLLATALVLVSVTKLSLACSKKWWLLALIGLCVAVFAKESFALLSLLFPVVGVFTFRTFGRQKVDLIAGFSGVIPALVLVAILAPTVLRNQKDIYGSALGGSRWEGGISAMADPALRQWILAGGVVLFAWLVFYVSLSALERGAGLYLLVVIAWSFLNILFTFWFYGGNFWAPRYRATFDLTITLQFIGAACLATAAFRRRPQMPVFAAVVLAVVASGFFMIRLGQASIANLQNTLQSSTNNAEAANKYQGGINEVLNRIEETGPLPVVLVVQSSGDYEPAYAVLNELARRGNAGVPRYLVVSPIAGLEEENQLLDAMREISEEGSNEWKNRPVVELARVQEPVCVFLNMEFVPVSGCLRKDSFMIETQGM
jgi:MFS family permease